MRDKCVREQWSVGDLDWSVPPRAMSRAEEMAVVQYFTDMAGIERLAGALFREQHARTEDPTLREIFASFEKDELRHAHCAQMLADHYDLHRYRYYQPSPHLVRFAPAFVHAIRYLSPEIANVYVTAGEILLDVALLRSIDDFVDDDMSRQAMHRINRDESRHIAIDFHMVEYYSSEAYQRDLERAPKRSLQEAAAAWLALGKMMFHARPFIRDVFVKPMDLCDPSGRRLREAFKRMQLVTAKPNVAKRPFVRFMLGVQDLFNQPVLRFFFGRVLLRILATDPRVLTKLHTDEEAERARRMSFEDLAEETLQAKYA